MAKYIAQHSVGSFKIGDEVKGLSDERIQALLASGAIVELVKTKAAQTTTTKATDTETAADNAAS
ncbi:hypothetical protein [Acinetobacter sp. ANC 4640]